MKSPNGKTSGFGYILLTLRVGKEDSQWTAECEELGTATYGDTLNGTVSELRELISLHLSGLEEVGERERFFAEHGIAVHPVPPIPTKSSFMLGGGTFPEVFPFEYPAIATRLYA
jgi:predicted RNase H-like HicB family nuclease